MGRERGRRRASVHGREKRATPPRLCLCVIREVERGAEGGRLLFSLFVPSSIHHTPTVMRGMHGDIPDVGIVPSFALKCCVSVALFLFTFLLLFFSYF